MIGARVRGHAQTSLTEGWRDLGAAGRGELELVAMAGTMGVAVHSHMAV